MVVLKLMKMPDKSVQELTEEVRHAPQKTLQLLGVA